MGESIMTALTLSLSFAIPCLILGWWVMRD